MRAATSSEAKFNSAGVLQPELASMLHRLHTLTVPNPKHFGQKLSSSPPQPHEQVKQQRQQQQVACSRSQVQFMRQRSVSLPDIYQTSRNADSISATGQLRSTHNDFETHRAALRANSLGESKPALKLDGSPHVVAPPQLKARSSLNCFWPYNTVGDGSNGATKTKNKQADSTAYAAVCETRARNWRGCTSSTRVVQPQRFKSTAATLATHSTNCRSQLTKRAHKKNGSSSTSRGRNSGSNGSSGGYNRNLDKVLPCGLTQRQLNEMMTRELTPEDYELLLQLDEAVSKPQTRLCSAAQVERFPLITLPVLHAKTESDDEPTECGACLCPFEGGDSVRQLPCCPRALFHPECIAQWLIETKNTCPACLHEYPREE